MARTFDKIKIVACILAASFWFAPAIAQNISTGCGKDMQQRHKQFLDELGKKNFYSKASTDKQASDELILWLQAANSRIVKHENAHKSTAGKWGGEITYLTFKWWGIEYATAGCVPYKSGIPLNTLIRAQLAPDRPSAHDQNSAAKVQQFIKIKKARAECLLIRRKSHLAGEKCLKPYKAYKWLDRYPLD